MAARGFALAMAVVAGVIVADIIVHGAQTAQAASGVATIEKPALNALLGQAS